MRNKDKNCKSCGMVGVYAKDLCRSCYNTQYWIENKTKLSKENKKYHLLNKEHVSKKGKEYYLLNREKIRNTQTEYNKENKEKIRAHGFEYYWNNRDIISSRCKNRYINSPGFSFLGKTMRLLRHEKCPDGYVWHHTCYDHADPEANMVLLSRSSHNQGHQLLCKLGIEIPHINRSG